MQIAPEQVFFRWCIENDSNFSKSDLMESRIVCRKWNAEISKTRLVYKDLLRYNLYKLLYYDKGVYDEHHVRRLIILKKLAAGYDMELIPIFALVEDDLDDIELITTVVNSGLPLEFREFLELYREFPSDKVRIYSPEFMMTCANMQGAVVRDTFMTSGAEEVNKMITIHPLCYSKHYKGDITDIQYINVLCYLNVIGEYGEPTEDFSNEKTSRYFILILELDNLQDDNTHRKLLKEQIKIITTNVYMNWDYLEDLDLQIFTGAVETLIKQQKFNL